MRRGHTRTEPERSFHVSLGVCAHRNETVLARYDLVIPPPLRDPGLQEYKTVRRNRPNSRNVPSSRGRTPEFLCAFSRGPPRSPNR
jgi:hypothetical protein